MGGGGGGSLFPTPWKDDGKVLYQKRQEASLNFDNRSRQFRNKTLLTANMTVDFEHSENTRPKNWRHLDLLRQLFQYFK